MDIAAANSPLEPGSGLWPCRCREHRWTSQQWHPGSHRRPESFCHVPRGGSMRRNDDDSFGGWRYEAFEERLALSVQPVADFWYDTAADSFVEPSSAVAQPLDSTVQPLGSTEGHGWTDLAAARDQYGLYGSGQTVAIIDSGIAYDHVA